MVHEIYDVNLKLQSSKTIHVDVSINNLLFNILIEKKILSIDIIL